MVAALYRSVSCNVQNTDSKGTQATTVKTAWEKADVLKLQEGNDVHGVIRNLRDAKAYLPGDFAEQLPIVWRASQFILRASGKKRVYTGGKGDGPSRGCTWVLLEHRTTKKRVLEFNMHQIAKAWTTETDRQDDWNDIAQGVATEIDRVMTLYPGVPVVISGDMNRSGTYDGLPGVVNDEVTGTPASYGGSRYDRFYYIGGIDPKSNGQISTGSDHDAIFVRFAITANSAVSSTVTPPASPAPVDSVTPKPPAPQPSFPLATDVRRLATYRKRPEWRFFAQRMTGDGLGGEIIHPDLPLADVEIEDMLTGHNGLTGTISPEFASLIADDGRPLLDEYGTAIWAEESGNIHGGGILTSSDFSGPQWGITCTGLTGYLEDLPYASSTFFVETDPLDILRHIWTHVQSQPGSNLGLEVDPLLTGLKVGTVLEQVEFDTQSGPVSFESGPYKLAWYQTHNLADNADGLASDTPFDWHEEHYWVGDVLHHRLRLGYPNIGRRRADLRFVIGENVHVIPDVNRDGAEYADEVWVLGAGEGSAMKRGVARANINKLRRVAVVADPSLRSQTSVNAAAQREVKYRNTIDTIASVVVRDHPHADIGSVQVGDEVLVEGPTGWIDVNTWYRVVSRTIRPFSPDRMELALLRSDRIAA